MADTIITNTPDRNSGNDGSAGWFAALVIVLVVLIGGFFLYQNGFFNKQNEAPKDETTINVTIPNPVAPKDSETPQNNP